MDIIAHELTRKHFNQPPLANPSDMKLVFRRFHKEVKHVVKKESSGVGPSIKWKYAPPADRS